MNTNYILVVILGMAIVTYIPRILPMIILSKNDMPDSIKDIMKFIPIAILSSLIAKDIFFNGDNLYMSLTNPKIISGIIVLLVAYKFKSIAISIAVGAISICFFGVIL
ncbi:MULTISPECIES: AzlD domain-containing protein [unclassified Clostridioides]|uniref:AzlD domain-containing protein n=1 Tax=unclassified Clostridioides TaxID=2635829 RepID=UPI0006BBBC45|nr:transporter [Clostridioides difficile]MCC0690661.1 AzlD domain-containing protein [Clostridioides sp. ZZV14-6387]KPI47940.1 transporter [Clostridioides difficile]MCI9977532.1 AzlD domain-containing protein [Clostridioides difficile]MDB3086578.1 AzlD domain-containing protein [Clostridioides difficile]